MPEATIHLKRDAETGKKTILIDYHSDQDALPMEHEDDHRAIADSVIEGGLDSLEGVDSVVVRRHGEEHVIELKKEEQAQDEALSEGNS